MKSYLTCFFMNLIITLLIKMYLNMYNSQEKVYVCRERENELPEDKKEEEEDKNKE